MEEKSVSLESLIEGDWKEDFEEGVDYDWLPSSHSLGGVMVLYESGVEKAILKTKYSDRTVASYLYSEEAVKMIREELKDKGRND